MTNLDINFEKGVRLLAEYFPVSKNDTRKSILFHDIRVGNYLYERDYNKDIVLAALLHDSVEWSDITLEMIMDKFNKNIADLVDANTKNRTLPKAEQNEDMIKRCVKYSEEALIVKAVDILDSYRLYTKKNNKEQLINHCLQMSQLLFKYKPSDYKDAIFEKLKKEEQKVHSLLVS